MKTKSKDVKKRRGLLKGMRKAFFRRNNQQQHESSEAPKEMESSEVPEVMIPNTIAILPRSESTRSIFSAISCTSEFPTMPKCRSIMTSSVPSLFEIPETESESSVSNNSTSKVLSSSPQKCVKNPLCLTETKFFKTLVEHSLEDMDMKDNGSIGKNEFYSGLLLIHISIAKYAGFIACTPPTHELAFSFFENLNVKKTGLISKEEYVRAMATLSSRIITRVAIQWIILIMILPVYISYRSVYPL